MRLPGNLNIKTVEGLAQTAYLVFYRDNTQEPFPLNGISLRGSIAQGGEFSVPMEFEITGENTATMSWPQMKAGSCRYDVFMVISEHNEVPLFGGIFTFVKRVTPWLQDEVATPEFARRIYVPSSEDGKVVIKCCDCDLIKSLVAQAEAAKNVAVEAAERAEEAAKELEDIGIENIAKVNDSNNFSVKQELDAGVEITGDSLYKGVHMFERDGGDGYTYRLTIGGSNGARRTIVFEQINQTTGAFANRTVLDAGFVTANQLYLNLRSTENNAAVRYDQMESALAEKANSSDLNQYYTKENIDSLLDDKANINGGNDFSGINMFQGLLADYMGARSGRLSMRSDTIFEQNIFTAANKGIYGVAGDTGVEYNIATLRTYGEGTAERLVQLEIGSEQDLLNLNSINRPTFESPDTPQGGTPIAILTDLDVKANISDLGSSAFVDIGSDDNWSEKVVVTDVNGLIPPELLPPNAGEIVIESADTIADIIAEINSRAGIIEGTKIEVIAGNARGNYIVNKTKPDGTYAEEDIDERASFSGVDTVTVNGNEYIPVNGNVDLGDIVVPSDLDQYLTVEQAQAGYTSTDTFAQALRNIETSLNSKVDLRLDNRITGNNVFAGTVSIESTYGTNIFSTTPDFGGTAMFSVPLEVSAPRLPAHAVRLMDLDEYVTTSQLNTGLSSKADIGGTVTEEQWGIIPPDAKKTGIYIVV